MADTSIFDNVDDDSLNAEDELRQALLERRQRKAMAQTMQNNPNASFGGILSNLGVGIGSMLQGQDPAAPLRANMAAMNASAENRAKLAALSDADEMKGLSALVSLRSAAEKARNLATTREKERKSEREFRTSERIAGEEAALKRAKLAGEIKASTASEKPGAKDERDSAGYAKRMEQSESVFSKLSEAGFDPTSLKVQAQRHLPDALEYFKPEKLKSQEQAERNFINATLRRESGASISPQEFSSAEKQYFPRAGDTPLILAQKAANRAQTYEGIKSGAGKSYEKVPSIPAMGNIPEQTKIINGVAYTKSQGGWKKAK